MKSTKCSWFLHTFTNSPIVLQIITPFPLKDVKVIKTREVGINSPSYLFLSMRVLESWIIHKSVDQTCSNWILMEKFVSKLIKLVQTCFLNFRNWKNADLHHPLQPQNLHAVEHLSCNYETKRINLIFWMKKKDETNHRNITFFSIFSLPY